MDLELRREFLLLLDSRELLEPANEGVERVDLAVLLIRRSWQNLIM